MIAARTQSPYIAEASNAEASAVAGAATSAVCAASAVAAAVEAASAVFAASAVDAVEASETALEDSEAEEVLLLQPAKDRTAAAATIAAVIFVNLVIVVSPQNHISVICCKHLPKNSKFTT